MERVPFRAGPRSWRARIGLCLSLTALGLALSLLVDPREPACAPSEGSATLDLTPMILVAVASAAVVLDVRTLRGGEGLWAGVSLAIVSIASLVGTAAAVAAFFRAGC